MKCILIGLFALLLIHTAVKADEWDELEQLNVKINLAMLRAIKCQSQIKIYGIVGPDCKAMADAYNEAGAAQRELFTPERMQKMESRKPSFVQKSALREYKSLSSQAKAELDKALALIEKQNNSK